MKDKLNIILQGLHRLSVKVLVYFSLVLFSALAILNIFVTTYFSSTYDEWSLYRVDNILVFAVLMVLTIFVFLMLERRFASHRINARILLLLLMIFTLAISVTWVIITHSTPIADRLFVSMIAEDFLNGNYSAFDVGHYLYKYPYQLGITACIEWIYSIVGSGYYKAIQLLNAVAVCVTFYALYRITRLLFGKKPSKMLLILLFGCFCTMFFCTYVYGNLFGLAFAALAVWMELVYLERRKTFALLVSIVCISISMVLKNNFSIVLIAMLIMLVIDFFDKKELLSLIFAVLMFACTVLSSNTLNAYYSHRADIAINEGVPMVTFIAMGLQDGWFGKGTYSKYTVDTYEAANYNEEKASEIGKAKIKEQMAYYLNNPKSGIGFFAEKTALQWAEPTYMSIWDSNCANNHTQELSDFTKSMYVGFWHNLVVGFMNFYQSFVWLCASYYVIRKRKTVRANQMMLGMIIIGGFLCHLLWEAKSQYTIQYFVFAIPYAAAGCLELMKQIRQFFLEKHKGNNTKGQI